MFVPPGGAASDQTNAPPSAKETAIDLVTYVSECLDKGSNPDEIRKQLIAMDLPPDVAREIVGQVLEAKAGRTPQRTLQREQPRHNKKGKMYSGKMQRGKKGVRGPSPRREAELLEEIGQNNKFYGGLWFFGGLIISLGSFALVSGEGRGSFVITWGAVVWGIVQFMRGVGQVNAARRM